MNTLFTEALLQAGDSSPIREQRALAGGDINKVVWLRSDQGQYVLKSNRRGLPGFFAAEAHGLAIIAATKTLRVPQVLAFCDAAEGQAMAYIVLEWLSAPAYANRGHAAESLGQGLAALHRASAQAFGLDRDGYIGLTPQPNGWHTSWLHFFREQRLGFQAALARRNGYFSIEYSRRMEKLLAQLERWLDPQLQPSLLHGDLWGGNWMVGPDNAPVLIDPAAYYGDREADLAFTTLFGGFSDSFYHSYYATWPLPDGWQERRDLYNLYHLLNHLNLFGEGYLGAVDAILRRYTR